MTSSLEIAPGHDRPTVGGAAETRTREVLAIAIPTAVAAVLCLLELTGRSLGFDEGATVTIAAQHGSALGSAIAHDGGNMSGFYLLEHVLIGAFGNGAAVVRFPSVVAAVATVALTSAIGLRLFGYRAAFAAGLLAAVSLPLVFWAQSARGYALMIAFVTAAYLVLISIATQPAGAAGHRRGLGRWAAFAVLMALATYSTFVAVLVIPAQLLALLPRRRRAYVRPFIASFVGYAVLCVPLFVLAVRRGSGQLFWVPRPTHKIEVQVLQELTSAGLQPSFHRTATTTPLLILTLAALVAIAVWAGWQWRRRESDWGLGLALAWLAVPVATTFVYSLVAQPLFQPRNVLMAVPAVALLLGAALVHPGVPKFVGPAALVALVALRALQLGAGYGVSPEPWRQATAYVQANSRPGDCIAFYPLDGRMAFQYYVGTRRPADASAPRSILPVARWGTVTPYVEEYATLSPAQIAQRTTDCRRLWFVSSHEGQLDGPAQSLANRARYVTLRERLTRQFGHAPIKQFGYAAAVHVQLLARQRSK
ncbi:MAG TPA: glycosyltransferase family 39 protein [Solirubrobacteraceae bacterium]|nr:glycosyltransferase family 39 protein [Solirubrobacteraceae bacterium]